MRALSACLTAVLALGLGVAACSSSSSDDSAAAGAAAGGSAGATTGGSGGTDVSAAGADDTGCANLPQACQDCVVANCATPEGACISDDTCDTDSQNFEACACKGDMTLAQCTATFSATGDLAKAVADCSTSMCATPCNL